MQVAKVHCEMGWTFSKKEIKKRKIIKIINNDANVESQSAATWNSRRWFWEQGVCVCAPVYVHVCSGAIMYNSPLAQPISLSLYPLRRPWWDTTFHLLIAVIGACEGEVHVFCSPSASVRELENGILWRAVCVCLPHPRWHIFIIRSGTKHISLSCGRQHTLKNFAILKIIYIAINFEKKKKCFNKWMSN